MKKALIVLNVQKTNIVVFNQKSRQPANLRFYYDGHIISIVDSFKYLGCILSGDLTDVLDIDRCNKAFNKSAGFLLRKFNNADIQIFLHLFNSFCSTLYGCELWIERKGCARALKEFSVSYHAVLKKTLNVTRYFSNHYVCGILSLFAFEHFINIKLTRFMLWIKNSKSDSFYRYKYYFLYNSIFMTNLELLWKSKYNVPDVLSNDIDALVSRIDFIQKREPFSMYIPLNFNMFI